jgi:uncharacterized membrane protein
MLARILVSAAIVWPIVAGAALVSAEPQAGVGAHPQPGWATLVYAAAGTICHQRPERSFHLHAVSFPVCARCTGLYVAAPFAALVAYRRRSMRLSRLQPVTLVAMAAVPTALTLLWEWGGLGTPSNLVRFATALPLGAAIAFVVIATVSEHRPSESIR